MPPNSAALRRILALMRAAREAGPSVPHGGGPPIIHDSAGLRACRIHFREISQCCYLLESGISMLSYWQCAVAAARSKAVAGQLTGMTHASGLRRHWAHGCAGGGGYRAAPAARGQIAR